MKGRGLPSERMSPANSKKKRKMLFSKLRVAERSGTGEGGEQPATRRRRKKKREKKRKELNEPLPR